MNWLVINKKYQTIEASVSALPNAIMTAEQFDIILRRQVEEESPDMSGTTVN